MQFFDLVALNDGTDLEELAKRLRYKKIFNVGKDLGLISDIKKLSTGMRSVVKSNDEEVLIKAIRNNDVIGVIADDKISMKLIDELHKRECLLLIPTSTLVCSDQETRVRNLHRAKVMLRNALIGRVRVALVTLAEERACMLSSSQMLEIAGLLGATEKIAKEMLSAIGNFV
jgi:RNase P/RNase MRP subunit p30